MRANSTANSPPPTDHYTIIIMATGDFYGDVSWSSSFIWHNTVHCKWVPSAAYYGHHPGPINKKIVNITNPYNELNRHYSICLCLLDGILDCNTDKIGPIYPGKCISFTFASGMSVLYAETYDASISQTGYKVVHQNELVNVNEILTLTRIYGSYFISVTIQNTIKRTQTYTVVAI